MKKVIILLYCFLMIACSSQQENTDSAKTVQAGNPNDIWSFQGWGGEPGQGVDWNPSKGETKEYYYLKVTSKASPRSVELKSPAYMESSCKASAKKESQKIYESMVQSVFKNASQAMLANHVATLSKTKDPVEVSRCKNPEENKNEICECLIFKKFPGGQAELEKKLNAKN